MKMKSYKVFFSVVLYTFFGCFCRADYITKSVQKNSSLIYKYYSDISSEICSLVLTSDNNGFVIDRVTLVHPHSVSYVCSLLFNVINSYKCKNFFVHIGGLNSNFKDTNCHILDKDIIEICKSFGFRKIYVDGSQESRKDVFCANSLGNNKNRYITRRSLRMFKSNANLKSNDKVINVKIENA